MRIFEKLNKERGAVEIVEAAFVFPIVIFVVILFIMFGNLLYQQAKVDAIAVRGAQYLAALYTNPLLKEDTLPTDSTKIKVQPYRYLLGDGDAESKAKEFIKGNLSKTGTGFFSGMEINPKIKTCEIKNYVFYQKACVEIEYSIKLVPMKLFGESALIRSSSAVAVAATDAAEFIRNVDMIMDYSKEFGLTAKIQEAIDAFKG